MKRATLGHHPLLTGARTNGGLRVKAQCKKCSCTWRCAPRSVSPACPLTGGEDAAFTLLQHKAPAFLRKVSLDSVPHLAELFTAAVLQAAATGEAVLDEELGNLAQQNVSRFQRLNQRLQVSLSGFLRRENPIMQPSYWCGGIALVSISRFCTFSGNLDSPLQTVDHKFSTLERQARHRHVSGWACLSACEALFSREDRLWRMTTTPFALNAHFR